MITAVALFLSLSTGDRAVILATSGDRTEITDPAVVKRLESLMIEAKAPSPAGAADWTVTLYQGEARLREVKVSASSSPAIIGFLRDQDRIRQLSRELASDSFEVRETASRGLVAIGRAAVEPLRQLSESSDDVEVRSRAARIVKDIHAAARPRVQVRFVFARKENGPAGPAELDDWIRAAAAGQGYPTLEAKGWTEWSEFAVERNVLFPAVHSGKPGGVYVYGQILEWTMDGAVTLEIANSVKGWKSGRFELGPQEPRKLIRLSDQAGADLFIALKIRE